MTFGSGPAGSSPFGGGPGTYNLLSATPFSSTAVDLLFDAELDPNDAEVMDATNYIISGPIVALAVVAISSTELRLYTTEQTSGTVYTVTVDADDVLAADGSVLGDSSASWTALSSFDAYSVSNCEARSHCQGRRIDLFWTNPTSPAPVWMRILRRQKNRVFNLDDSYDTVYDGPALDEEFFDTGIVAPVMELSTNVAIGATTINVADTTGLQVNDLVRIERLTGESAYEIKTVLGLTATTITVSAVENAYTSATSRVSKSSQLQEQTWYYYTVLVSDIEDPEIVVDNTIAPTYAFTDNNHARALSISVMDSKEGFFWRNTPQYMRERDAQDGGEFLDKLYEVMGCWLNLARGHAMGMKLLGDPDQAPYQSLSAKVLSLGTEPDGFSYDYEIPRRMMTSLINVYKRRGTCAGLIRATRMFTKWDASCTEFSIGSCLSGPKPFRTWNGISLADKNTSSSVVITNPTFQDSSKSWNVDDYKDGLLIGPCGDIACIESNTSDTLTLKAPLELTTTEASVLAGVSTVQVARLFILQPGLAVQITHPTNTAQAEVHEILSVDATVTPPTITFRNELAGAYPSGSSISVGKSTIRKEYVGSGSWITVSGSTRRLTEASARWVENQWVGYKVLARNNTKYDIVSNTTNQIFITSGGLPTSGEFAIARDFTTGGAWASRTPHTYYRVYGGDHSFLFEPTFDLEARGTVYDPFTYLWMGLGSTILGAWGPGDVGIYILSDDATEHVGQLTTISGEVLTIDSNQPAPAVNEFAGMYLNPNQNQTKLFRIASNTATTITVEEDISDYLVAGQYYYVMTPRNAARFRRLVSRLGPPDREFANQDINVRVLFV